MRTLLMLKTYAWIINTLRNFGPISFQDLMKRWNENELSKNCNMVRQTFWTYRNDIEEFFHITIECDKQNRYYIGSEHALDQDSVQNFMAAAVSVTSTLSEHDEIYDHIILEEIPSTGRFLKEITDAIKRREKIIMIYQKYEDEEAKEYTLDPYYVKLYQRRWYLIGKVYEKDKRPIKTFGLDRIKALSMTKTTFKMNKKMNAREYFKDCYGVMRDETKPAERIVLRAFGTEVKYLRDVRMHPSQREIEKTKDYSDFELYLRPSWDVMGFIMSRGDRLKVLEPAHFAEEISQKLLDSVNMYKK